MGFMIDYHVSLTRFPPERSNIWLFCSLQDVEMQDRLKTLEESHQRSMDELQNSHRLKDSTNGAWGSGSIWHGPIEGSWIVGSA